MVGRRDFLKLGAVFGGKAAAAVADAATPTEAAAPPTLTAGQQAALQLAKTTLQDRLKSTWKEFASEVEEYERSCTWMAYQLISSNRSDNFAYRIARVGDSLTKHASHDFDAIAEPRQHFLTTLEQYNRIFPDEAISIADITHPNANIQLMGVAFPKTTAVTAEWISSIASQEQHQAILTQAERIKTVLTQVSALFDAAIAPAQFGQSSWAWLYRDCSLSATIQFLKATAQKHGITPETLMFSPDAARQLQTIASDLYWNAAQKIRSIVRQEQRTLMKHDLQYAAKMGASVELTEATARRAVATIDSAATTAINIAHAQSPAALMQELTLLATSPDTMRHLVGTLNGLAAVANALLPDPQVVDGAAEVAAPLPLLEAPAGPYAPFTEGLMRLRNPPPDTILTKGLAGSGVSFSERYQEALERAVDIPQR